MLQKLWANNPVRVTGYSVLLLVTAFLVTKGFVDQDTATFVESVAALVLGVGGIEVARAQVTPDHKV